MPKVSGEDNKYQASHTEAGRSYKHSVKIEDVGGASHDNPHPHAPFVEPNPGGGGMITPEWKERSGC